MNNVADLIVRVTNQYPDHAVLTCIALIELMLEVGGSILMIHLLAQRGDAGGIAAPSYKWKRFFTQISSVGTVLCFVAISLLVAFLCEMEATGNARGSVVVLGVVMGAILAVPTVISYIFRYRYLHHVGEAGQAPHIISAAACFSLSFALGVMAILLVQKAPVM